MESNRHLMLVVGLLLVTSTALAQEAPAPAPAASASSSTPVIETMTPPQAPLNNPGGATLGDLDRIQGEILLAQARTKLAESKQTLAKAEGGAAFDLDDGSPPVVAGVFGPAERPYARFLMEGGQMIGREGDTIGGGYRVVRIGVDKVVIKDKKGREVVARFSGTAPVGQGATGATSSGDIRSNGLPAGR